MTTFFIIATIVNIIAAAWILGAIFTDRIQSLPRWHILGLLAGGAGLLWQAFRNILFLVTGVSPSDSDLPLWFLKDLGYIIIAFSSIWLVLRGTLKLNNPPPKKPTTKRKTKTNIKQENK
jgi:hypothetical protein